MNGSGASRRRMFLVLAPLLLGSIVIPAGRSDAADSKPTAAQVADGLKSLQKHVDEAAEYAATDKAKAQNHWNEAHETWEGIEDAIGATHKDSYTAYEAALQALQAAVKEGDAKAAAGEAAAMANTTKNYLEVFSAAAKPAPASSAGERTAAADTAPAPAATAPAPAATASAAPAGTLARTGSGASVLTALAGAAFGLGGLSVIGGSRRRRR
jgi:hypothetical protein